MLGVAGGHHELTREVGAAGSRMDANALHGKIGMRMQQLRQHALDLHARRMATELDARRCTAADIGQHLRLELRMGGGGVEVGQQVRHVRGSGWSDNLLHLFSNPKPGPSLRGRRPVT